MAFTFPLSAAEFFGGLDIAQMRVTLDQPRQVSRTGNATLEASLGDAVRKGEVQLVVKTHADQAAVEAMLEVAARPGASFLAHDTRFNGPAADPGGAALSGSSPVIDSVDGTTNLEITISGLPAGYEITAGDVFGWEHGSDPVRYAYYRAARGAVADGTGVITIETTDFIKGGVAASAVVFVQPVIKAKLDAQPDWGMGRPLLTGGAKFSFTQVLGR